MFLHHNSFCEEIAIEFLRKCNSDSHVVRDEASSMLYLLIKNHQQLQNFRRISVLLMTALAKLVNEGHLEDEPEMFELSLSKLCSFALFGN